MIFPYAETHYKFRLPWSPLHKRRPEIFLDAPHQVVPGKSLPVFLLVKDADSYPVKIKSVEFRVSDSNGMKFEKSFELDLNCGGNLITRGLDIPIEDLCGDLRVFGWITVETPDGKSTRFLGHNFPGIDGQPLQVRLLEHPLPYPSGWKSGEMHCHSEFSSDPVEFGAPLAFLQQTADSVGLDFVLCTDHSYDFYYHRDRYMVPKNPEENFQEYRNQALELNATHPSLPTLVPGEEVSCANGRGENVHVLVFGPEGFLPGHGDGGRRWFNNRPDFSVAEILNRIPGVPAFAAHPKAKIGWLERKIFRRGEWDEASASLPGIRGLQFWNGNLGADYRDGKAFWISQLLRGRETLPIGANDAHGDFNQNIGVKTPLFSLYQSRSHLFGKVRTVVPCPTREISDLRQAFMGKTCVCTDGPFATVSRRGESSLGVLAQSNGDFGALRSVTLLGAESGSTSETSLQEWTFENGPMILDEAFPIPRSGYVRLEAVTLQGRRALSSALFLDLAFFAIFP